MAVLKKIYLESIVSELLKTLELKNKHEVPALEKIVINSRLNAQDDKTRIDEVYDAITQIAGQKAITVKAKQSISNFKLREGMPNGVKVTLRGERMYDFYYRLVNIALPIIRDFRGVSTKLDGRGNYNIGIADHTIFPEINTEGNRRNVGMDITIVTTAENDEGGRELLKLLGMPFRKPSKN
jgi:large subunit ribosomal protein L5